ncbi:S8 family peptidase [Haloarchaeobius amylolyticus]|uniref:S8 family peptidase n=1 Tax=Haloarchaeobius amylolyticus TaxID=1198296 RepID=UPI002271A5B0
MVGTKSLFGIEVAKKKAASIDKELDFGDRGNALVGNFSDQAIKSLQRNNDVRYVEEDVTVHALAQSKPWGIDRVDADVVHSNGQTGEGAHIAILDTGIDADHPDLQPNLGKGYAVENCSGTDCVEDWDDDHSHGTHCAGIANAVNNDEGVIGVSTQATLHAVKVLSGSGSGSASGVAEGIKWAADQGYGVISMSLGASSGSSTIRDALQYAQDRDVIIISAAGNEGPCTDCVHYPGAYPESMAIGSTASDDSMSSFSSTGPEVEMCAPGSDILSCVKGGGYQKYSGTSMATPHVSGAAGLLRAQGLSASETRKRLTDTAEDLGHADNEQGAGLLDVEAAVGDGGGGGDEPATFAVETRSVTDLGTTQATLNGELTGLGDASSATVGFKYWQSGDRSGTEQTVEVGSKSAAGTFSSSVSGLTEGVTYQFLAYAVDDSGTEVTGAAREFTTTGALSVTTAPVADVGDNTATLTGNLQSLGNHDEADVGFHWWAEGMKDATLERREVGEKTATGEFSLSVSELRADTTYVVQAYANPDWDTDEDFGSQVTFTTGNTPSLGVKTGSASNVTDSGATLSGEVTSLGESGSADVGVNYWVAGDRSGTEQSASAGSQSSTGSFSVDVSGLDASTGYEFEAYADDGTSSVSGAATSFTTGDAPEQPDGPFAVTINDSPDWSTSYAAKLSGEITSIDSGVGEVYTEFQFWEKGNKANTFAVDDSDTRTTPGEVDEMIWGLAASTTYVSVIRAFDDAGNEVFSGQMEFTTSA